MTAHSIASPALVPAWLSLALAQWRQRLAGAAAAPPLSRTQRAEREANEARTYAERIQASDPRMAAEIMAAADRHESQFER